VFPSKPAAFLWTSTIPAYNGAAAVYLGGNYPTMTDDFQTATAPGMHCVRGGPLPAGAMTVSTSGAAVSDPSTGLTWQRDVSPSDLAWLDALTYCNTLTLESAADWRLPSYKELWTIVDVTQNSPAIDLSMFPSTPKESFWTSSPVGNDRAHAYTINFQTGPSDRSVPAFPMTQLYRARCVRGGS
jgi:hypothetical protein